MLCKLNLLHGEQYLSLKKPLPSKGTIYNRTRLIEALDKKKAASLTYSVESRDERDDLLMEGTSTVFVRGTGGFGGPTKGAGEVQAPILPHADLGRPWIRDSTAFAARSWT
jgi:hypothetical protein